MNFFELMPGLTDRAVFCGQTGSGKTRAAEELLKWRKHVVVYDTKGLLRWEGFHRVTTLAELVENQKMPKLIYAPIAAELGNDDAIEAFFRFCYLRGNCTVYVDEVYGVAMGASLPDSYHALLTRGRELGLSTWSSTQRPKDVPQAIFSESEHFYVFRLQLPQDRRRIREVVSLSEEALQGLAKHRFYYARPDIEPVGSYKLKLQE